MPSLLFDDPPNTGILGLPAPNITPPDDRTVSQGDALAQVYRDVMERVARERQVSAERGLWDDETGRPTARGLLDAGQQYGNALLMGTTAPGRPGFTAYHGSPHDFPPTPRNPYGEFDASKVGTGEGAQAYGVGAAYLAEREGIARGYRDQLAGKNAAFEWNGQTVPPGQPTFELVDNLANQDWRLGKIAEQAAKYGPRSAIEMFEPHTRNKSDGAEWLAAMERFKEGAGKSATGRMYEVQVNADPEHFLHWDKPLSEQSAIVQAKIRNLQARNVLPKGWTPDDMATLTGRDLHQELRHVTGSDAKSAALLGEAVPGMGEGIPGIRYLDQGSRAAGEGSHNYVVFDAATLNILRKYGLAGLMAGGAATGAVSGNNQ